MSDIASHIYHRAVINEPIFARPMLIKEGRHVAELAGQGNRGRPTFFS